MQNQRTRIASVVLLLLLCPLVQAQTAPAATAVAEANAIRVLLAPDRETTLFARMGGRVDVLNAGIGQAVKKGQRVAELECGESNARLQMARAELLSAQENLKAKDGLRGLNAAGDMDVAMARAAVDRAEGAVALGRSQISYCVVDAPFNGRIARVYIKQYQSVSAGAPVIDLVSEGLPRLRLNVPSVYLQRVKVGTTFDVTVNETGKTYPARVLALNARIDAVAQTVEVEGRLEGNPRDLLSGMSGVARFGFKP